MICPDSDLDCDNVGCRRGGCQGRRPKPPLFRALPSARPEFAALAAAANGRRENGGGHALLASHEMRTPPARCA